MACCSPSPVRCVYSVESDESNTSYGGYSGVWLHVVQEKAEPNYLDIISGIQLEVTWGIMQKAFIEQFKEFEDLIEKCYPGSSITLEFTIEDLTNYISQAKSTQQ